jgi:hypothetical protein
MIILKLQSLLSNAQVANIVYKAEIQSVTVINSWSFLIRKLLTLDVRYL